MNGFELRQRKRNQTRELSRKAHEFEKVLETAGVQSFFEEAYISVYGRMPKLSYKAGWFLLQGKRYSREKLKQMAMQLYSKAEEIKSE